MAVTFSTSLAAGVALSGAEPRVLIDLGTVGGPDRLSTEPLRWSGVDYAGRVVDAGDITCQLGAPDAGVLTAKSFSFSVANADGFYSKRRPGYYAGNDVTVREVLLDVQSDAIRTFTFTVARVSAATDTVRFDCEERWAPQRRNIVPSDAALITTRKYPAAPAGVLGASIPLVFGRALVPMYFVDESSNALTAPARYVVGMGSCSVPTSGGTIYEEFGGKLSPVLTASFTAPYSLQYATRDGVVVTEVLLGKSARYADASAIVPRWIDLQGPDVSSIGHPDSVLLQLCAHPVYGAGLATSIISSDSLLTARSFYLVNSMTFDCAITQRRTLEDWLGDWCHDALTGMVTRDTIRLVPQSSRTAQGSFAVNNILRGSYRYEDAPLGQQDAIHTVGYYDRGNDLPGSQSGSLSTATYAAGSGVPVGRVSPFIGRRSVAARVAQTWAKRALAGIRTHGADSTLRQATLEEGDLATFTHPWHIPDRQVTEVQQITRRDGVLSFQLREHDATAFNITDLPLDRDIPFAYPSIFVSYAGSGSVAQTITTSHGLRTTPTRVAQSMVNGFYAQFITSSLVNGATTNNSQMAVYVAGSLLGPLNVSSGGGLLGWAIWADPDLV